MEEMRKCPDGSIQDPSLVASGWVSLFNDLLLMSAIGLGRTMEVRRGWQGVRARH
jgi:hypothetical protein